MLRRTYSIRGGVFPRYTGNALKCVSVVHRIYHPFTAFLTELKIFLPLGFPSKLKLCIQICFVVYPCCIEACSGQITEKFVAVSAGIRNDL